MLALTCSRVIVPATASGHRASEADTALNGQDFSALDQIRVQRVTEIESSGIGFVLAGYFGPLADLDVEEDTRRRLIPVDALRLSVRSMNCLRASGISTVGELIEQTTEGLLRIPNMGLKSVSEIRERLAQTGVSDPAPSQPGKRSLDLRLLLRLRDIDSDLKSLLSQNDYATVWEVCSASFVALRNRLGSKNAFQQLEAALERVGVPMSTVIPKWLPPAADRISEAFSNELRLLTEEFRGVPATLAAASASFLLPASSTSLADEIDRCILAGVKPEYKPVLAMRKGWAGGCGATLEEVGTHFDLTRERVRQIEKKLKPAAPADGFCFLAKALALIQNMVPCAADTAEAALWAQFPDDLRLSVDGLLSAAEAACLLSNLKVERLGTQRFIGSAAEIEQMRLVERAARADVSHYGVGSLDRVCLEISTISRETVIENLRAFPGHLMDPNDSSGFYVPTTRNSLLSRLRRILSVISPVSAELARGQILRDQRMEGSFFSPSMLLSIAETQPWCCIAGGEISRAEGFESEILDSNEAKVVALIRQHGPVVDSRLLQVWAAKVGVSDAHLTVLLGSSPLIVRHGRALYGLVGSVANGDSLASCAPGSNVAGQREALVWEPSDEQTSGDESFQNADVSAPDFCLRVFAHLAARAKRLRGEAHWSMVEVFGSQRQRKLLLAWGREGAVDLKWLRSRSVVYESEQFPAKTALALLFLAYSAEAVRTESAEGEMWRQIRQSLNPSLAAEFFFGNGYVKPWLREATELVCRRLHVRHAFGHEGEQGWLRTVYLQFGMTTAGFKRLPYWLSGYGVPVAVEDLQTRSSDLFSPSFVALWEVLGDYRVGAYSELEATKRLISNPWSGPDFADQMLAHAIQRREIVRGADNSELETESSPMTSLFLPPRLLWRENPYFELLFSPDPPPWLEDSAYTLVVSDGQRLPIKRVDDSYEMAGVGSTLLVSARLRSISVDILQRRVSVLPETLEIDFTPSSELAFYRLSDGRMFEPWDQLPRGGVPFAVIHRVSSRLEPSSPEFSLVLGGDWQLSAYRQGLPPDLRLSIGQQIIWQRTDSAPEREEAETLGARIICDGGKWGEHREFTVVWLSPHLRPVQAIIGSQVCPLASDLAGRVSGIVTLEPTNRTFARLIAREGLRLRSFRVPCEFGPVTGAAFDHFGKWAALRGTEILPVAAYRERLFCRPPLAWKGENFEERDWAVFEGDRILNRPSRRGQILIHSLMGLGEELRLAVNHHGDWLRGFKLVQGVVDTGLIRIALQTESVLMIELLRDIEFGEDHQLWVWSSDMPSPGLIPREKWSVDDGSIVADLSTRSVVAVALAFRGVWLGATSVGWDYWEGFREVVEHSDRWSETAGWLRWFRVPALLPALRSAVRTRVESAPADTFLAWTGDRVPDTRVCFSEEHREKWAQLIRSFFYFWKPNPNEALQILRELGVVPEDPLEIVLAFERTGEGWQNADVLARIDPGIFSGLVVNALPAAYGDARPEERAVLVKILRKQLMGTDQELSLDDFSTRIGLDRRFASAVLNAESLRWERSFTLRIALCDYSVRQFVCVRVLDEALSQGLI